MLHQRSSTVWVISVEEHIRGKSAKTFVFTIYINLFVHLFFLGLEFGYFLIRDGMDVTWRTEDPDILEKGWRAGTTGCCSCCLSKRLKGLLLYAPKRWCLRHSPKLPSRSSEN